MLEFICSIPDWLGWTIVGFFAALCLVMMIKLGCVFVEMWKDYKEARDEDWEE
jgi:hypothetical protein